MRKGNQMPETGSSSLGWHVKLPVAPSALRVGPAAVVAAQRRLILPLPPVGRTGSAHPRLRPGGYPAGRAAARPFPRS